MFIRELKDPITALPGVGKSASVSYAAFSVFTTGDVLLLSPRSYEDRSQLVPLGHVRSLPDGGYANTIVEVIGHSWFGGRDRKKRTLKITIKDISGEGDGRLSLLCFGRNFLEKTLKIGHYFYFFGPVAHHMGELQSSQFEMVPLPSDGTKPQGFGEIFPIYPLTGMLSQRIIRRDVQTVLAQTPRFEDELPIQLKEAYHLLSTDDAIRNWHFPQSMQDVDRARKTLAFTELFYLQLISKRRLVSHTSGKKHVTAPTISTLEKQLLASLPFTLTEDQLVVLTEIRADMAKPIPMNRLLQGDVGSGKTLVAWISALHLIAEGGQVAFMAPTELLARQHADLAAELLSPLGIRIAFLTGSVKAKERKPLLEALKHNEIDIIIGTHALFSQEVTYHNLRYVIIDEQHRFGVEQRMALLEKGVTPDVLMMTATPIPRTLALTVFGDLHISTIKTMPQGRIPIITHLVADKNREKMYRSIGVEFSRGHQAYFVYPRIDDSGESELRDVMSMYELLTSSIYPNIPAALIHSKLPEEEKIAILSRFRKGELTYLVSTSVVEVGLDVPNATCMVIEHAERFGLSALHQLRGRVGRSTLQSWCFLVYSDQLTEEAKQRLKVLHESTDGFFIAEQDLLIRGPGEITGIKQSGFLKLRYASLTEDLELIASAKQEAERILKDDPGFIKAGNEVIREVLKRAPPFDEQTFA